MRHHMKTIGYLFSNLALLLVLFLFGCNSTQVEPTPNPSPVLATLPSPAADAVQVGILGIRSAVAVTGQYGALITYLSETIDRPFTLVPLNQEDQFTRVGQNNLEFVFSNPLAAMQIQRLYDTQFLATISRPQTGTKFSGLIVVNAASDIETLDDLRDKRGACVAFATAAGGCNFQIFHLRQHNLDPYTDFSSFIRMGSQDNIVLAVLNNTVDVGFIRTGQLERMVNENLIASMGEIRILDRIDDDYFYPHTTRLYPEWPFAALSNTDPELKEAVKRALLNIPPDHPAMQTARANGFISIEDYTPIDELIEDLKLRSWDAEPN